MNILHINTSDITGGAARATYRLHTGLHKLGHESQMYVLNKKSADPTVTLFERSRTFPSRVYRFLRRTMIERDLKKCRIKRPTGFESFSDDRTIFATEPMEQLPPTDICNLHWITRFIDYAAFLPLLVKRVPVVWTLHDMWPFTGGCHYAGDCR